MSAVRRILHVDMDAFYASVEQRDDPSLRGQPVTVGGDPRAAGSSAPPATKRAQFGVRSAMPMSRAVRLCPELVIVPPASRKYRTSRARSSSCFAWVTPLVEPLSLDEAYLDVTENAWGETLGMHGGRALKDVIREKTGLTASAGVAPNKFLAKIASGWKKPDGLTVIAPERVERFLQGLPIDALWGVGPVTAARLRSHGIESWWTCARIPKTTSGSSSGAWRRGCGSSPTASTIARSSRTGAQVGGQREHVRTRPDEPGADPGGGRSDGPRRRAVARAQGACWRAR